jgi:ribosome-binding ATPase
MTSYTTTNMLIGLVGKPNCGKSTFFKAATLAEVEIGNYPFVTIKPNKGIGYAKTACVDKEFNKQCNPREGFCINHNRFIPIQIIDVAGLVPGAHEGKGMGAEFLNDLNQADLLIHVIDSSGSTNEKGEPTEPLAYDPLLDIRFLEQELDRWFFSILNKNWEKMSKTAQVEKQSTIKSITKQLSGLRVTEEMVKEALQEHYPEKLTEWKKEHLMKLSSTIRRKTKPMIIAANKIDIPGADKNLKRIQQECKEYTIMPCSAEAEVALKEAAKKELITYIPGEETFTIKGKPNEKQKKALAFIKEHILKKFSTTGVQNIIDTAIFNKLNYIQVYPGDNKLVDKDGKVLPDCYLFKQGATAEDFAFRIHTDIGKNFIKAMNIKTKQVIGKDYALKKGDIIEIMVKR